MKKILFILLTVLTVTSYSIGDNALDRKIDANSKDALEKSILGIKKDLSKENSKDLTDAMVWVLRIPILKSLMIKEEDRQTEIEAAALELFRGKTARELITSYKNTKKGTTKNIEKKKEEIKEIKIGESVVCNDIEITLKNVSIGKLKVKYENQFSPIPKNDFLLIKVQLKNLSEGKIRTIQNTWSSTKLQDNFENFYKIKRFNLGSVVDVISSKRIKPGEMLIDTMIFNIPLENAKEFTVISKPSIYKSKGDGMLENLPTSEFQFKFNRSEIK